MPNKPVIDKEHCTFFLKGKCKVCEKVCPTKAIRYDQEDRIIDVDIGAIVLATGFNVLNTDFFPEYGYGKYKDVINGLQFERIASASGPTSGAMKRPSDGKEPETIVFVACAGSRDAAKGIPYCSKICCMYTAKHAMLYKHKVHHGNAYVFYMDIRSGGKMYDEFVRRAIEEDDVKYIRGRVSTIYEEDGKLVVKGADTLLGHRTVEIKADMVVLATARRRQRRCGRAGAEAARELRPVPLLRRGAPEAAPGRDEHRGHLPGRRLPGAAGHTGDGRTVVGRGEQGRGALLPERADAGADHRGGQPHRPPALHDLHGVRALRSRLPLPGDRDGRDQVS